MSLGIVHSSARGRADRDFSLRSNYTQPQRTRVREFALYNQKMYENMMRFGTMCMPACARRFSTESQRPYEWPHTYAYLWPSEYPTRDVCVSPVSSMNASIHPPTSAGEQKVLQLCGYMHTWDPGLPKEVKQNATLTSGKRAIAVYATLSAAEAWSLSAFFTTRRFVT